MRSILHDGSLQLCRAIKKGVVPRIGKSADPRLPAAVQGQRGAAHRRAA